MMNRIVFTVEQELQVKNGDGAFFPFISFERRFKFVFFVIRVVFSNLPIGPFIPSYITTHSK